MWTGLRLETYYMRPRKVTAITAPIQINASMFVPLLRLRVPQLRFLLAISIIKEENKPKTTRKS